MSIDGQVLTPFLPYGLFIEDHPGDRLTIHEPPQRALTGLLALPFILNGRLSFVDLFVPSNGRFSQKDLRILHDAGAELASWRAARSALARSRGTYGMPEIIEKSKMLRDWRSLADCADDAASLLARWPGELDRRMAWLAVGVPGGTEDVPLTAREAERHGYIFRRDDSTVVTRSARWLGEQRPLVSASIGALALAVVQLVRLSLPGEQVRQLRALLAPVLAVADLAAAPAGHHDRDPSSWPRPFVDFAASCMKAIAELQSSRRGKGSVPLLDTDELYEAWLTIHIRDVLIDILGPQDLVHSKAFAAWTHARGRVELWIKPSVGHEGHRFDNVSLRSVVAEVLIPDLVMSASSANGVAVHVVDAKSWSRMLSEDVLSQAAKYLYGLRRVDDLSSVPAIAGVDLVTCAISPSIAKASLARVHVTTATPTVGTAVLRERIRQLLEGYVFGDATVVRS